MSTLELIGILFDRYSTNKHYQIRNYNIIPVYYTFAYYLSAIIICMIVFEKVYLRIMLMIYCMCILYSSSALILYHVSLCYFNKYDIKHKEDKLINDFIKKNNMFIYTFDTRFYIDNNRYYMSQNDMNIPITPWITFEVYRK